MLKVIVIIVTYNGEKWIQNCLSCLQREHYPVEIVIIDNASTDQTKQIIKKEFSEIRLIENNKNLGFGQANNIGMELALQKQADYVFLLNQDAYVYPDTISKLLSVHERHSEYGIISPLQLNNLGGRLDDLFRKFILNNYPKSFVQKVESGSSGLPDIFPVRFINAAAWFISKSCLQKTGLFHLLFYHYGEDNNYSSRVQYHEFKVGITPLTAIRHDKIYDHNDYKLLQRQIELVPLYILLDLRKNICIAYLLVFWKLIGYFWKGIRMMSPEVLKLTFKRTKWVLTNFSFIWKTRKEMKRCYMN